MSALAVHRRVAVLAAAMALAPIAAFAPSERGAAAATAVPRPAAACPAVIPSPQPAPIGIGSSAWLVMGEVSSGMRRYSGSTFLARADGTVWRDGCIAHLDAAGVKTLAAALAQTHEERWRPSYGTPSCCDQQSFSVGVVRASHGKTTSHAAAASSATYGSAPPDWQHLYETLEASTHRYGEMARHESPSAP